MHRHHEGDEGVDAEEDAEHAGRDDAHEFEVHFADQGACVDGGSEGAEDGDLVAQVRPLLLGERDEGFRRTL